MKPKLIIFDWDGTLADTTNPIIHTFQQSFADCGLPVPEADQIRPLIGYSLSGIIRRLAHNVSEHVQETLIETYAAHYLNPNNRNMTLFPFLGLTVVHQPGALDAVWSTWSRNDFHRTWTVHGEADSWVHGGSKEVPPYYAENNDSYT